MSEPRLISPMLDRFAIGGAISDHSGVRCYPAMREDSDERYIVKIISIPASQEKLQGLLLSGAFSNAEAACGYYQELAEGIRSEVDILRKLAERRGFLPFVDAQVVPMAEGVGYEVYLLSYYRHTLGRHLKKAPLTHLSAVNLGIDLCAALALCREAGYLYVSLKPENIFINTAAQSYHLGDLGFLPLASLKYASLPDRCRSAYTPPEVEDAFATLNTTMDTYALGLTLYQIYNNGQLPFDSEEGRKALMAQLAAGEKLPAPAYADYEMAEIILKACAYDPAERWQTPQEMAEALISYMKRNGANDVPIVPPTIPEVPEIPAEQEESVSDEEETLESAEDTSDEEKPEASEEQQTEEKEIPSEEQPEEAEAKEEEPREAEQEEPKEADWIDRMDAILAEDATEESVAREAKEPSLRELLEPQEEEEPQQVEAAELSDDTAAFLNQVQELIEHEAPGPAVAPEPIEVPVPDPIVLESEEPKEAAEEPAEEEKSEEKATPVIWTEEEEDEDYDEDDEVEELSEEGSRTWKRLLTAVVLLLLLAAGTYAGFHYYRNYYLQEIDSFTVEGQADTITVTVVTDMDMSLLTVVCKDTYGQVRTSQLNNGQAVFEDLQPGSQYILTLEVEGFHELVNAAPASYSTPERTQIVDMNAITGPEDGTAIFSFGVEGPEGEAWTLTCSTPGEADKVFTFTGHNYTVVGLTPDVAYEFTLSAPEEVYLIGECSMVFTARSVIYAQNLVVTGYEGDTMTIGWDVPEGVVVNQWTARCYNAEGYDEVMVVTEPSATFTGISADSPYTLEVTAEGMTQSSRTFITASPVIITDVAVNPRTFGLDISWTYQGNAPANGWLVLYTVDNSDEQQVILTDDPSVSIYPAGPGSHYEIIIQTADATSVFNGTASGDVPTVSGNFSGYGLRHSNIDVRMYRAPGANWNRKELGDQTTTFRGDDTIAIVYYTSQIYNLSRDSITTVMVLQDAEGNLAGISSRTRSWDDMWQNGYCTEEFSHLPDEAGSYTLSIYLNGKLLSTKNITVQ